MPQCLVIQKCVYLWRDFVWSRCCVVFWVINIFLYLFVFFLVMGQYFIAIMISCTLYMILLLVSRVEESRLQLLTQHFPVPGHQVSAMPMMSNLSLSISRVRFVSVPPSNKLRVFHVPDLSCLLRFILWSIQDRSGDPSEELFKPPDIFVLNASCDCLGEKMKVVSRFLPSWQLLA